MSRADRHGGNYNRRVVFQFAGNLDGDHRGACTLRGKFNRVILL
jgi:hypothetical protein